MLVTDGSFGLKTVKCVTVRDSIAVSRNPAPPGTAPEVGRGHRAIGSHRTVGGAFRTTAITTRERRCVVVAVAEVSSFPVGWEGICRCATDSGAVPEAEVAPETYNSKDFRRRTTQGRPVAIASLPTQGCIHVVAIKRCADCSGVTRTTSCAAERLPSRAVRYVSFANTRAPSFSIVVDQDDHRADVYSSRVHDSRMFMTPLSSSLLGSSHAQRITPLSGPHFRHAR